MVLLRHITAPSPAYTVHYYSAVYTICMNHTLRELREERLMIQQDLSMRARLTICRPSAKMGHPRG